MEKYIIIDRSHSSDSKNIAKTKKITFQCYYEERGKIVTASGTRQEGAWLPKLRRIIHFIHFFRRIHDISDHRIVFHNFHHSKTLVGCTPIASKVRIE